MRCSGYDSFASLNFFGQSIRITRSAPACDTTRPRQTGCRLVFASAFMTMDLDECTITFLYGGMITNRARIYTCLKGQCLERTGTRPADQWKPKKTGEKMSCEIGSRRFWE